MIIKIRQDGDKDILTLGVGVTKIEKTKKPVLSALRDEFIVDVCDYLKIDKSKMNPSLFMANLEDLGQVFVKDGKDIFHWEYRSEFVIINRVKKATAK